MVHNILLEGAPSDAVLVLPSSSMAAILKALTPLPCCQVLPVLSDKEGPCLLCLCFLYVVVVVVVCVWCYMCADG